MARLTRRTLLVAASTGAVVAACDQDDPSRPRELLWSEEFDNLDLASPTNTQGRWRPNDVWQPLDQGYADFATGQRSTWAVNPAQQIPGVGSPFSVSDSVLTISTTRTPPEALSHVDECPWLGGMLISNTDLPEMSFGYGYYEFRARVPVAGRGMFPAMWFYAARDQNPGKPEAEIDLFEVFGEAEGNPWHSTLHGRRQLDVQTQNLDTAGWHTYGIYWTAGAMDFYHDGRLTEQVRGEDVAFFEGATMSIRVNLVMDAEFFADDHTSDASTPDSLSMEVDYIRQYDKF